ncbi:hypothetical protein APHWI1_1318 [Anaplasma phagocytophilum str. ApWI1]|uniref:Uncharacterized protein n=2 Tax=Anaplasma phagocytophilum TaxID=948 RepID=A0A0F3NKF5_ANAPH|nr:hypothetical protein APHWEB_0204 [Anaplasma phagocytophilum str. Webster]KJV68182.1 hypothetical protein EPHNCH_0532 [Anaplasma phagocytophilum str. NCH-1]KJV83077.1 hypothetical protein APHHGE2_0542 [Anaplasma phagocytophilum str. HGE2]KJV85479.1 hypothetical protein APHWI1_1318 [Anaplasma phagocytophilum str. ApWI1]KJV88145.1 hypothetical protein APHNYW_0267 [Anaplasma phagocytophilum str. ApNYW]KJV99308.1 hypothetical protein OTSANNIE_0515 [Anaplasma phagocytophilum str. Annie]KJZ98646.
MAGLVFLCKSISSIAARAPILLILSIYLEFCDASHKILYAP